MGTGGGRVNTDQRRSEGSPLQKRPRAETTATASGETTASGDHRYYIVTLPAGAMGISVERGQWRINEVRPGGMISGLWGSPPGPGKRLRGSSNNSSSSTNNISLLGDP